MSTGAVPEGGRRRRLRPRSRLATSTWCAAAVALVVSLLDSAWVLVDRSSPSWDQSSYLSLAIAYNHALASGGPGELVRTMHQLDPSRGPLFVLALMPFLAVFGDTPRAALLLNVVLTPVLLLSVGEIARRIFMSPWARLVAIVLVGTTPIVVGLQHNVLVDFLLITLTCVSVALLLRSELFRRRGTTIAMGVVMGLGALTKVTFPAFVLGPVLVALVQLVVLARRHFDDPDAAGLRPRLVNVALALAAFGVLFAVWYVPNRQATLDYIRSTTGGDLALGAGPADPLTLHNVYAFNVGVATNNLSWLLVVAGLCALALGAPRLVSSLRRPHRGDVVVRTATMLTWIAIPYLLLVTGHNQDVRLMAPALAAYSTAVAGGLCAIRLPVVRAALVVATCVALVLQTANRVVPLAQGWLPDQVALTVRSQTWVQPIGSSATLGYQRLPLVDRATPVMDWIQTTMAASARPEPRHLCLLESYPIVNSNTFRYLDAARRAGYEFVDVILGPDGRKALAAQLAVCDVALFIKPVKVTGIDAQSRVSLVNDPYAANYMGPRLLAVFDGPRRSFPVGDEPVADDAGLPVDDTSVVVLTRR